MAKILIIQAHPNSKTSFCSALASAYARGAQAHATTEVVHLSDLEFDPVLHAGYGEEQALENDLMEMRRKIEEASHVVWVFPMWWVGVPALLKGFIDRLFLPGWAFSYDENHGLPEKLLGGRSARVVATMDSPNWWYILRYRQALKTTFEKGTLAFCGISPIKRTLYYSIQKSTEAQRVMMLERATQDGLLDAQKLPQMLALSGA